MRKPHGCIRIEFYLVQLPTRSFSACLSPIHSFLSVLQCIDQIKLNSNKIFKNGINIMDTIKVLVLDEVWCRFKIIKIIIIIIIWYNCQKVKKHNPYCISVLLTENDLTYNKRLDNNPHPPHSSPIRICVSVRMNEWWIVNEVKYSVIWSRLMIPVFIFCKSW